MKIIFLFLLMLLIGCHKSKNVAFTYQRALDSMNIPLSAACWIDSADSVIFNPNQTITEKLNGQQITFGIDFKGWRIQGAFRPVLQISLNLNAALFPIDSIVNFKFYNCISATANYSGVDDPGNPPNSTDTNCKFSSFNSAILHFKKH